jgi:hypothetical protein
MSSVIGSVKAGSGKRIEVKWSETSKEVYVSHAGWKYIGHASSAREAMKKAEAWAYDK